MGLITKFEKIYIQRNSRRRNKKQIACEVRDGGGEQTEQSCQQSPEGVLPPSTQAKGRGKPAQETERAESEPSEAARSQGRDYALLHLENKPLNMKASVLFSGTECSSAGEAAGYLLRTVHFGFLPKQPLHINNAGATAEVTLLYVDALPQKSFHFSTQSPNIT